jgi:hypothetical protein
MEMNKGEAEKCRDIAKKFLREGKWRQAIKFFEKSHRLYPLPGVEAMCERAKAELAKEESGGSRPSSAGSSNGATSPASEGMRRRGTASSSASADEPSRPFTPDQMQIVNKIRACKTHYDVLSVAKTADDGEIKKAYRKVRTCRTSPPSVSSYCERRGLTTHLLVRIACAQVAPGQEQRARG